MAGTELPANAIAFTLHQLSLPKNQAILSTLRSSLSSLPKTSNSGPDFESQLPSLANLEKCAYLTAIIKESLRLSSLIPGRLPRVIPAGGLVIPNLIERPLPGGTVLTSSAYILHMNPEIFVEPEKFCPERWLEEVEERRYDLEEYLVPFSVRRRNCIGRHLAVAEMRLVVAALVGGFEFWVEKGDGLGRERWRDCIVRRWEGDVKITFRGLMV